MAAQSFPDPVFEGLLDKLVKAIETAQSPESTLNQGARQALFQATSEFKDGLAKAKQLANTLPGGELLIEEQEEVIAMLAKLRDTKREQLAYFSKQSLTTSLKQVEASIKLEIDSTASSPQE
ncbi:hypothetical protein SCHPADRAFT_992156 [Schizopora paradoxa]|uniref:Mediator of RNA polymerase II transcription subunit 9 n=1 Tax=Schizopora paradoxa TaxID=27342 RepID=A0A0H2SSF3_9AGAM|nr:hypothetical protein SCHPADRAFT_992156 [Schizopora paradoxa]